MHSARVFCCVAALLTAVPCAARFRIPEIEQVPVDRLIANLESELRQLLEQPGRAARIAETQRKIARAHSIAYASGSTTLAVRTGTSDLYEPPPFSGFLSELDDAGEPAEDAAEHLQRAIFTYEAVLRADRYDIRSRLGLAWALEQSGQEQEALEQYRIVAAATWPVEQRVGAVEEGIGLGLYIGEMTLFMEAAHAVIRLLDSNDAAAEIAEFEARLATFNDVPRFVTPILVPLDASDEIDGLVDAGACVAFDLDGSGLALKWAWITPRAAWLVWDPEGSGRIESGLQLFGSVSFFVFWNNGYEALAALDDDGDGGLRGPEIDGLALWADADADGISDPGEVRPVREHQVASIATAWQEHERGFPFSPAGLEMADGEQRATYDWIARSEPGTCGRAAGGNT